ncbi:MAG: folylpolyglutamate synthase/dihydrofolate synthase family protein [Dehalococcoidia bacterium]|jgi:dihydrofolate synthase/folylpolyglutamate synthase
MTYREAIKYILSFTDYEKLPASSYSAADFDLRRVEELLHRLGDPHLGPRTVHIAGTKGKGSTAAMMASALTAAGHRTGLYTSPHLHTFRERIRIDGEMISEAEFATTVEGIKPHVETTNSQATFGKLTTFEVLTVAAFAYFKKSGVRFQVLETGLGGRLDATNVAKPEVCIITPISLDHTEILGSTIAEIAREKAGIIKPGAIVIVAPQNPNAMGVIKEAAARNKNRIINVGSDVTWRILDFNLNGQEFEITTKSGARQFKIPLLGKHQIENAAVAVAALEALGIDYESIFRGLANVRWPGRLEIIRDEPIVLVDGAHNADSARRLSEAIKEYIRYDDMILVIGASSDKDIKGMLVELAPLADKIIATKSTHPRALPINTLLNEIEKLDRKAAYFSSVSEAVGQALLTAWPHDLICVTGSLFVVAEAIEHIKGIKRDSL